MKNPHKCSVSVDNRKRFLVTTKNSYTSTLLKARPSALKLVEEQKTLEGKMRKRSLMSHAATVTYVGEMATELARMAAEVQSTKLAYILEVAALEAKTAVQPHIEAHSEAAGGLH